MNFSIETRLPFLDYRLVEHTLTLPAAAKIKFGWTKYVLRKAMEALLPEQVIWRKKKYGFEAPTKRLLAELQVEMAETISNSEILRSLTNEFDLHRTDQIIQWRLFNIAKWEIVFGVKPAD